MSTNLQRREHTPPPPPPDERYWAALLHEGEFSDSPQPDHELDSNRGVEPDELSCDAPQAQAQGYEGVTHVDWADMQHIKDNDQVVDLMVTGFNRGGLLVEWRSLRGFVPASQLVDFPATLNNF